jgi:hypothetical protein
LEVRLLDPFIRIVALEKFILVFTVRYFVLYALNELICNAAEDEFKNNPVVSALPVAEVAVFWMAGKFKIRGLGFVVIDAIDTQKYSYV